MEFLQQLGAQLAALWTRWSLAQRAGMVIATTLSLAAIVGVGYWATQPEYVVLVNQLGPSEAAEVVSLLEADQIAYQLNFAGSAVSVPRQSVSRARLAIKDIVDTRSQIDDEMPGPFDSDPTLVHHQLQRIRERQLARSIEQIRSVRAATVHISQPEQTPFVRDRAPTKASVILDLRPNSMFTATDAQAITSIVSHGVEGLSADQVTVVDTDGRVLTRAQGIEADVTGQLAYRRSLESDLAQKAETMLASMLGPGHAVVRVTADVDFTETERKETAYDPDIKVKASETLRSESITGSRPAAGGIAGTPSNVGPRPSSSNDSGSKSTIEENVTEYLNGKVEDSIREAPGKIKRLTVAAIVDLSAAQSDSGGAAAAITQERVQSIIKQAVGFDAVRSDEIEVLVAPLAGIPDLTQGVDPVPFWEQYSDLIKNVSLGVAAILAFLLGLLLIRRMTPVVLDANTQRGLQPETARRLASLSQQAKENPDAVARVLAAWLDEPVDRADEQPQQPPQRAAG